MLVEEIDVIGAQAPQLGLDDLADVFRPAVPTASSCTGLGIDVEAELGAQDDLAADALQRLADDLLGKERAVGLGRVDQGDAAINGPANQRDGRSPVGGAGVQVVDGSRGTTGRTYCT